MLTDEQIEQWRKYLKESEEAFGEIHGQIDQLCDQAKAANRDEWVLMGTAIVRLEAGDVVILRGEAR